MSDLSNYSENAVNNHITGFAAMPLVSPLYMALFTTTVDDGGAGTEITGAGYLRQATTFSGSVNGLNTNDTEIVFTSDPEDAPWGEIIGTGLFTESTGGNLILKSILGSIVGPFVALAATDVVTCPGHGLQNGDRIVMNGEYMPGGIAEDTLYFVRDVTADTFKLAGTAGGAALDITTSGGGLVKKLSAKSIQPGDSLRFAVGQIRVRTRG